MKNIDRVYHFLTERKLFEHTDILNINIPDVGDEILLTKVGPAIYGDKFEFSENGMVTPKLVCFYNGTADLSLDTDATMTGHITVSPLTVDSTDKEAREKLIKLQ